MLDSVVAQFPDRDVVVNVRLKRANYFIDGISEHSIVDRLYAAGKLELINYIVLEWQSSRQHQDPHLTVDLLSGHGYTVLETAPHSANSALIYAPRQLKLVHFGMNSYTDVAEV